MPDLPDIDTYFDKRENDCVLYDRACMLCGECDRCDLNPDKTCDNCGACIEKADDENEVAIEGVVADDMADAPIDGEDGFEEPADPEDDDETLETRRAGIDEDELQEAWQRFRDSGGWSESDDTSFPEDIE